MSRTLIVSRETVSSLLEAHAALAAWYHRHAQALRAAGLAVEPPTEPERQAFLGQVGLHFPEVGEVAKGIVHPRPYVPPPAFVAPGSVEPASPSGPPVDPPIEAASDDRPSPPAAPAEATTVEPTAAVAVEPAPSDAPPGVGTAGGLAPPPLVDPAKVKY